MKLTYNDGTDLQIQSASIQCCLLYTSDAADE